MERVTVAEDCKSDLPSALKSFIHSFIKDLDLRYLKILAQHMKALQKNSKKGFEKNSQLKNRFRKSTENPPQD